MTILRCDGMTAECPFIVYADQDDGWTIV